jgi:hypothetical protein
LFISLKRKEKKKKISFVSMSQNLIVEKVVDGKENLNQSEGI